MDVVEIVLQYQLRRQRVVLVGILLRGPRGILGVVGVAEGAVQHMVHGGGHEGQVGVVLGVEQYGMLHVGLVAAAVHQGAEGHVGGRKQLAALAALVHQPHAGMHDVAPAHVFPSVLEVQLAHGGRVVPQVAVGIVVGEVLLVVRQQLGAEVVVQVQVGHQVALGLQEAVAVEVQRQALLVLGLEVLDVDLTRDALEPLLDARGALAHGDALHPRSGHIAQQVGLRGTPGHRQALDEHLHILAAEAQQLDLAGAHGGVVVVHVHRRIGDETLSEVAAGGAEQLALPNLDSAHGAAHAAHTLRTRGAHRNRLQCVAAGHGVDLLRLDHAGSGKQK